MHAADLDILCVQELQLPTEQLTECLNLLAPWTLLASLRHKAGGGVGILLHPRLQQHRVPPIADTLPGLDIKWAAIALTEGTLQIASVYLDGATTASAHARVRSQSDTLHGHLHRIAHAEGGPHHIVIAGDFNGHIAERDVLSRPTNRNGRLLLDLCNDHNLSFASLAQAATFIPTQRPGSHARDPSTIDYICCSASLSGLLGPTQPPGTLQILNSDHRLLTCDIRNIELAHAESTPASSGPEQYRWRSLKRRDWERELNIPSSRALLETIDDDTPLSKKTATAAMNQLFSLLDGLISRCGTLRIGLKPCGSTAEARRRLSADAARRIGHALFTAKAAYTVARRGIEDGSLLATADEGPYAALQAAKRDYQQLLLGEHDRRWRAAAPHLQHDGPRAAPAKFFKEINRLSAANNVPRTTPPERMWADHDGAPAAGLLDPMGTRAAWVDYYRTTHDRVAASLPQPPPDEARTQRRFDDLVAAAVREDGHAAQRAPAPADTEERTAAASPPSPGELEPAPRVATPDDGMSPRPPPAPAEEPGHLDVGLASGMVTNRTLQAPEVQQFGLAAPGWPAARGTWSAPTVDAAQARLGSLLTQWQNSRPAGSRLTLWVDDRDRWCRCAWLEAQAHAARRRPPTARQDRPGRDRLAGALRKDLASDGGPSVRLRLADTTIVPGHASLLEAEHLANAHGPWGPTGRRIPPPTGATTYVQVAHIWSSDDRLRGAPSSGYGLLSALPDSGGRLVGRCFPQHTAAGAHEAALLEGTLTALVDLVASGASAGTIVLPHKSALFLCTGRLREAADRGWCTRAGRPLANATLLRNLYRALLRWGTPGSTEVGNLRLRCSRAPEGLRDELKGLAVAGAITAAAIRAQGPPPPDEPLVTTTDAWWKDHHEQDAGGLRRLTQDPFPPDNWSVETGIRLALRPPVRAWEDQPPLPPHLPASHRAASRRRLNEDFSLDELRRVLRSLRGDTAVGPDLTPTAALWGLAAINNVDAEGTLLPPGPDPPARKGHIETRPDADQEDAPPDRDTAAPATLGEKVLLRFFTACLRSGKTPKAWDDAAVVPLYKGDGKDPRARTSWRPISLQSLFGKTYEGLLLDRLSAYMEAHGFLHPSQLGFREGKGTEDCMTVVGETIKLLNNPPPEGLLRAPPPRKRPRSAPRGSPERAPPRPPESKRRAGGAPRGRATAKRLRFSSLMGAATVRHILDPPDAEELCAPPPRAEEWPATPSTGECWAALIDISKWFDTVWKKGTLYKLRRYGVSGDMYRAVRRFLGKEAQRVRLPDGWTSPAFSTGDFGTRQGARLSPFLSLIALNDLFHYLATANNGKPLVGIRFRTAALHGAAYADDQTLLAPSESALRASLAALEHWCSRWKVILDPRKTDILCFLPGRAKEPATAASFRLQGATIQARYLGGGTQTKDGDKAIRLLGGYLPTRGLWSEVVAHRRNAMVRTLHGQYAHLADPRCPPAAALHVTSACVLPVLMYSLPSLAPSSTTETALKHHWNEMLRFVLAPRSRRPDTGFVTCLSTHHAAVQLNIGPLLHPVTLLRRNVVALGARLLDPSNTAISAALVAALQELHTDDLHKDSLVRRCRTVPGAPPPPFTDEAAAALASSRRALGRRDQRGQGGHGRAHPDRPAPRSAGSLEDYITKVAFPSLDTASAAELLRCMHRATFGTHGLPGRAFACPRPTEPNEPGDPRAWSGANGTLGCGGLTSCLLCAALDLLLSTGRPRGALMEDPRVENFVRLLRNALRAPAGQRGLKAAWHQGTEPAIRCPHGAAAFATFCLPAAWGTAALPTAQRIALAGLVSGPALRSWFAAASGHLAASCRGHLGEGSGGSRKCRFCGTAREDDVHILAECPSPQRQHAWLRLMQRGRETDLPEKAVAWLRDLTLHPMGLYHFILNLGHPAHREIREAVRWRSDASRELRLVGPTVPLAIDYIHDVTTALRDTKASDPDIPYVGIYWEGRAEQPPPPSECMNRRRLGRRLLASSSTPTGPAFTTGSQGTPRRGSGRAREEVYSGALRGEPGTPSPTPSRYPAQRATQPTSPTTGLSWRR